MDPVTVTVTRFARTAGPPRPGRWPLWLIIDAVVRRHLCWLWNEEQAVVPSPALASLLGMSASSLSRLGAVVDVDDRTVDRIACRALSAVPWTVHGWGPWYEWATESDPSADMEYAA